MAGIEADWSRISEDLLFSIVKLLHTRIDILRLRAVCRSFRATIPPPPIQYPVPHSILTNSDFLKGPDPDENQVLTLSVSAVYAIEPLNRISNSQDEETPQTWVIKIMESNSGRVPIVDPMTDVSCKNFYKKLPKSLNLLDYRVTEIGKFYELDSGFGYDVSKVVFSSFLDEHDDDYAVMTTYGVLRRLGVWRNVDQTWSHIDIELRSDEYIEDIIYHNDKFYALLSKGRTVTVDPKSLIATQVAAELRADRRFSMVGSINDLFLVGEYTDDDGDQYFIDVFKLSQKKRKWARVVDGLDFIHTVLFVGETNYPFSVSVKEFPRFKGGCVYYVDGSSDEDHRGQRTWVWDLHDGHSSRPILVRRNREEAADIIVREKSQG